MLEESAGSNCSRGLSYIGSTTFVFRKSPVSIAVSLRPDGSVMVPAGREFRPAITFTRTGPKVSSSEEILFATYHNAGLRIFDIRDRLRTQGDRQLRAAAASQNPGPEARQRAGAAVNAMINVQANGHHVHERLEWRDCMSSRMTDRQGCWTSRFNPIRSRHGMRRAFQRASFRRLHSG